MKIFFFRINKMDDFDEIAYKKEKEDWVTGHSGGSTWEINSVCGVLLVRNFRYY